MRVNKFNEEMKTVNYSDLKNWNVDKLSQPKIIIGNKELNIKLGSEVSKLLEEYGLFIDVNEGDWMKKYQLLLPDETNLIEYRVSIGEKETWEDFLDYNGYEYDELSKKEKKEIDKEFEKREVISDPPIEFSVFLPNNVENLEYAALADASVYLKLLSDSNLKGIMHGHCDRNVFGDETYGVKAFLKLKKIKINNDNIEDLLIVESRLYKDSKAFTLFEDVLEGNFKPFFNDWLNLIK